MYFLQSLDVYYTYIKTICRMVYTVYVYFTSYNILKPPKTIVLFSTKGRIPRTDRSDGPSSISCQRQSAGSKSMGPKSHVSLSRKPSPGWRHVLGRAWGIPGHLVWFNCNLEKNRMKPPIIGHFFTDGFASNVRLVSINDPMIQKSSSNFFEKSPKSYITYIWNHLPRRLANRHRSPSTHARFSHLWEFHHHHHQHWRSLPSQQGVQQLS